MSTYFQLTNHRPLKKMLLASAEQGFLVSKMGPAHPTELPVWSLGFFLQKGTPGPLSSGATVGPQSKPALEL